MTYEGIACDANNLYRAYLASSKGSKWKDSTQKFSMNYLRNIFSIQDDLHNRTLKNEKGREFILSERGRIRSITSIPIRDRVIRHVLCDDILLPLVSRRLVYDNGASLKGKGIDFQRKRFEVHLRKYHRKYGNDGWILFGDFSKFYDNIWHEKAICQLKELVDGDEFISWILDLIFKSFEVDVSYMTDEEYENCMSDVFSKNDYRGKPKSSRTGEKWMKKSICIGDQLSQIIGIYYPHEIDTYVKYVQSEKYYGRYMDDWYVMNPSKERLQFLLNEIRRISNELGLHVNMRKTRLVRISGTFKYLQIKYNMTDSGKIIKRVNPKRVTNMRRKLKKLAVKVEGGSLPYGNVEQTFRGWMCAHYRLLSRKQRRNMIELYENLFKRKIVIIEKKMYFVQEDIQWNHGCKLS